MTAVLYTVIGLWAGIGLILLIACMLIFAIILLLDDFNKSDREAVRDVFRIMRWALLWPVWLLFVFPVRLRRGWRRFRAAA